MRLVKAKRADQYIMTDFAEKNWIQNRVLISKKETCEALSISLTAIILLIFIS